MKHKRNKHWKMKIWSISFYYSAWEEIGKYKLKGALSHTVWNVIRTCSLFRFSHFSNNHDNQASPNRTYMFEHPCIVFFSLRLFYWHTTTVKLLVITCMQECKSTLHTHYMSKPIKKPVPWVFPSPWLRLDQKLLLRDFGRRHTVHTQSVHTQLYLWNPEASTTRWTQLDLLYTLSYCDPRALSQQGRCRLRLRQAEWNLGGKQSFHLFWQYKPVLVEISTNTSFYLKNIYMLPYISTNSIPIY